MLKLSIQNFYYIYGGVTTSEIVVTTSVIVDTTFVIVVTPRNSSHPATIDYLSDLII